MAATAFGEFLHTVRKRTKGTQVARAAGISYVYLMALANNLPFNPGEREHFFDLAAAENGCAPLDVSIFVRDNKELIDMIRRVERTHISVQTLCALTEGVEKRGAFTYDK